MQRTAVGDALSGQQWRPRGAGVVDSANLSNVGRLFANWNRRRVKCRCRCAPSDNMPALGALSGRAAGAAATSRNFAEILPLPAARLLPLRRPWKQTGNAGAPEPAFSQYFVDTSSHPWCAAVWSLAADTAGRPSRLHHCRCSGRQPGVLTGRVPPRAGDRSSTGREFDPHASAPAAGQDYWWAVRLAFRCGRRRGPSRPGFLFMRRADTGYGRPHRNSASCTPTVLPPARASWNTGTRLISHDQRRANAPRRRPPVSGHPRPGDHRRDDLQPSLATTPESVAAQRLYRRWVTIGWYSPAPRLGFPRTAPPRVCRRPGALAPFGRQRSHRSVLINAPAIYHDQPLQTNSRYHSFAYRSSYSWYV